MSCFPFLVPPFCNLLLQVMCLISYTVCPGVSAAYPCVVYTGREFLEPYHFSVQNVISERKRKKLWVLFYVLHTMTMKLYKNVILQESGW